ncbi:MAG TPA: aminopeptidase, partial [Treponema sp.]|nr:aminopeptidase [Treponema sp.]
MKDPRMTKLAHILVNYSLKLQPGEKVLIQDTNLELDFVKEIVNAVHDAGAIPFVQLNDKNLERTLYSRATEEQFKWQAKFERDRMKEMDAFIGFTSPRNVYAWSDMPGAQQDLYNRYITKLVHMEERVPNTRWVVLRFPSAAFAQMAAMSEDAFEEFYFNVCTLNYEKMSKAMDPLVELMEKTDKVRIISPGTDLTFSIKGLPAIKCDGTMNIPDGEVYTAPVKDSVNGTITYNTPSDYQGFVYESISFDFKNGKIVSAKANDTERINRILDIDEGAR